jgi:non-ribosomal peptide synthetase component F
VVGSVHANRERADVEKLIGILCNTILLRVNLSGAKTFKDVMTRVREVCLDAHAYQVPPELLREDMVKRGEERERLFDAWFQLERKRQEEFDMHGVTVTPYIEAKGASRFELSLCLGEFDEGIHGMLEYDQNMFTAKTTSQMLDDYLQIVTSMTIDSEGPIAGLSLTGKDEIEELSSSFVASLEI